LFRTTGVAAEGNGGKGIPAFGTEAEEAALWGSHELDDALLGQFGPVEEGVLPPPRPRTAPIAIPFDADVLRRIRALAQRKHKGYQTLLKEFVVERLYGEEKQEGILPQNGTQAASIQTGRERRA